MPQLNPEFFISQIFWLVITFSFLFIFLWRITLPRIGSVLEKRANKISEDIRTAKQYQAEAEEIQNKIDTQLRKAKLENSELIKEQNTNLQNHITKELDKIDESLNIKLNEASNTIQKNKDNSINQINDQIYEITKLTLSKISNIKTDENEIRDIVTNIQKKAIN